MKKILMAMIICLVTGVTFAQILPTGGASNVNDSTCFCCNGFYNLPKPIIYGPTQINCGDKPQYSIKACPGASISWTVSPTVIFTGNGTNVITLVPPLAASSYIIVAHIKCGNKEVENKISISVGQLKNCIPDFTYTLTLLTTGSVNINTVPTTTTGAEHYWGIVYNGTYPNCVTPCTAIPLATIINGGTWGAHETASGLFNPQGMGTGITAGTTGYGINYSGFPNCSCFKVTHYVNCCGIWYRQTQCISICTSNMKIIPGGTIKPLSSEKSEVEMVEKKDLPKELRMEIQN